MKVIYKTAYARINVTIYGIYFVSSPNQNIHSKAMFYGLLEGNTGLTPFDSEKCEILDAMIGKNWIFYESNTTKLRGVFHRELIEQNLLDGLIEHDAVAMQKFLNILKLENENELSGLLR